MNSDNPIPYGRHSIDESDISEVIETLRSLPLTQGPKVRELEQAFCEMTGSKYAVAVSNGTAALHLSALALGAQKGSRVITTPLTFAASANCILYCSGEIELVDIDPKSFLIDLNKLEHLLNKSPAGAFQGLIPVSFAGLQVDGERLQHIAKKHELWILEDACHAPGAFFKNTSGEKIVSGSNVYSDVSIFSFHPVKHIAAGEGGLITTNDEKLYQRMIQLRSHGISKQSDNLKRPWLQLMTTLGYNYRLSDLNAALAASQVKKLKKNVERRNQIAEIYRKELRSLPIKFQEFDSDKFQHAYHLFVIRTPKRDSLFKWLTERNIFPQIHYTPIHLHPYYQACLKEVPNLRMVEEYFEECISLPIFPSMREEEINRVITSVTDFFNS